MALPVGSGFQVTSLAADAFTTSTLLFMYLLSISSESNLIPSPISLLCFFVFRMTLPVGSEFQVTSLAADAATPLIVAGCSDGTICSLDPRAPPGT